MARIQYEQSFSGVEVQQTFYQPPQISTLKRWRQDSPADFEFTLKAWQLITHEARSPTYRRLRKELSETEKDEAGFFKAYLDSERSLGSDARLCGSIESKDNSVSVSGQLHADQGEYHQSGEVLFDHSPRQAQLLLGTARSLGARPHQGHLCRS
jgi:hypothetical protein